MKIELPAALKQWIENIECSDIAEVKLVVSCSCEAENQYLLQIRGMLRWMQPWAAGG